MEFARRQFELSAPQDDGQPLLAHLKVYEEANERAHPLIADAPPLPDGLESLWSDFLELHDSRGSTGWGPARITFTDLQAWQSVRGTMLTPFEVDCIRRADNMWLVDFAPKPKEEK